MKAPLSLRCAVSPPIGPTSPAAALAHVQVSVTSALSGPPLGLELKVARVGPTAQGLPVLPDAFRALGDCMGARDSLIFAGRHATGVARAGPEPVHALRAPWPDLPSALHGLRSLLGGLDEGRLVWVVLIIESAITEASATTVQALQALLDEGAGLDLVCTHPAADLGLLSRLAQRTGGELIQASSGEVVERLLKRVGELRDQRIRDARLEVRAPRAVRLQRLARVRPAPALITIVPSPEPGHFTLPVGLAGADRDPSWLFTVTVPGRQAGRYRLFELTLRYEYEGQPHGAEASVVQTFMAEPPRALPVEAGVNAALSQVETVAWIEEITRAHHAGDARRVAGLLDRLVRHAVILEDRGLVTRAFDLRLSFLRTGTLDATDLNRLRRQLTTRSRGA